MLTLPYQREFYNQEKLQTDAQSSYGETQRSDYLIVVSESPGQLRVQTLELTKSHKYNVLFFC